ncbi:transposase [Paracoccaceae bacterium GXU_MW_L88]
MDQILSAKRIDTAKRAFSTRRVPKGDMRRLLTGKLRPEPGDLVLARVDEIIKHTKLELTDGRRAHMFAGDEIVVAFGNRYAPDQYEAQIAEDLSPCDLVAAGGLAAVELSRHQRMLPPTKISPLGIIARADGSRLNLADYGVKASEMTPPIPAILSLGTSMNAGKTLTAMSLVRGFKRLGHKVAALKITGTGAGGDIWIVRDAGADIVADFTDAGFASTYLTSVEDIENATMRLMNFAADNGCDLAVIEIADGLMQLETSQLIRSKKILDVTIGTVFAAYDSMGAKYGADMLRRAGHNVVALSGRLGRSPLGVREAELSTGLRVFSPWELQDGMLVPTIRDLARKEYEASNRKAKHLKPLTKDVLVPQDAIYAGEYSGNVVPMGRPSVSPRELQAQAVLRTAMQAVMKAEVDEMCRSAYGARGGSRVNRRNGFRKRKVASPMGPIALEVPRLRKGGYVPPKSFDKARRAEIDAVLNAETAEMETALAALLKRISPRKTKIADLGALAVTVREAIAEATPPIEPTLHPIPDALAKVLDDAELDDDLDENEADALDMMNEYGHTRRAEEASPFNRSIDRPVEGFEELRYIPIPGE